MNNKNYIAYESWFAQPHVHSFSCKKVVLVDGKYGYSSELKLVVTKQFLFVLDILNSPEKGYGLIAAQFKYVHISSLAPCREE